MLCKVVLAFESVNIVFSCSSNIVDTILQGAAQPIIYLLLALYISGMRFLKAL